VEEQIGWDSDDDIKYEMEMATKKKKMLLRGTKAASDDDFIEIAQQRPVISVSDSDGRRMIEKGYM
jgi:hypothetical protein